MRSNMFSVCGVVAAAVIAGAAGADITIETVAVGDVGNTGFGSSNSGRVTYAYSIGKYEVTNNEYMAFLNAKAKSDPNNLYNTNMGLYGGIIRSGTSGSYTYTERNGRGNLPVNYVSFWDAARFSNWLQNGQGNGDTETGAYTLTSTGMTNNTITRNAGATWAVASSNEWVKAAYYKGGGLNAGFWRYGGSGTYTSSMGNCNGLVRDLVAVGSYAATSAYGARDMIGNAWEWTEEIKFGSWRNIRGSAYDGSDSWAVVDYGGNTKLPTWEDYNGGFRVSNIVPAPGAAALLGLAGLVGGRRRKA